MFCVEYRKDMFLNDTYLDYFKRILLEISERYFLTFETIRVDEDHVHLLVQAASRYSSLQIMQIIKSVTARELFKQFPEIKHEL